MKTLCKQGCFYFSLITTLLLTNWFQAETIISHALITLTARDKECIGCGSFVDWQKAFDTVDHNVPMAKINHQGVREVSSN